MFDFGELSTFILFTAIHCFILGGLILRIKNGSRGNLALSLIFLLFGVYLIEFYGVIKEVWPVWMSLWTYPLLYGLGPLLFQLVKGKLATTANKSNFRNTVWIVAGIYLVFIPFFVVNFSATDLMESSEKLPLFYRFILAILIYPITYQLFTMIWLVVTLKRITTSRSTSEVTSFTKQIISKRYAPLRLFISLLFIYFLVGITYELLHLKRQSIDFLPYIYLNLSLSLLLQGFGYIMLLRPELLRNIRPIKNEKKYERDLIPESALPQYEAQLASYWERQPYLSDDFHLEELSHHLGLSKNQASQLVNRIHGMSFSKWVKVSRIEFALKYWKRHSNGKLPRVKDMIFSSGFQNTVSFYRAFKEIRGESFPAFKEKQKKDITSYEL